MSHCGISGIPFGEPGCLHVPGQICSTKGYLKDNLNISDAANFLVKHIMATENDILKSVVPDTISPQMDSSREMSCSGCFK
ncbi:hypothetical protein ATANTOWER_023266 [Ataeniobius toweri]|uniref:Uncharacterized protein n=1 Tax=Ataeniobius toweri TaxID=208326 RepID=A0ABU7BUD2_9TELE|nr:hypothetical protein [Ataeniobius toweri]